MHIYTAQQTAELLPFDALVDALRTAATEYADGLITSPERMVVPLGTDGVMLSMPAVAADIAIHKLVNVQPDNTARGLPTIHGQVAAFDSATGQPLFTLDGPVVTGRRTAAVSLLGIETLLPTAPKSILIIGTGTQAAHHVQALQALHPLASIWIRSRSEAKAQAFCARYGGAQANLAVCPAQAIPEAVEVVITVTTSRTPVYDEAALAGRLVVAVGAFTPDLVEIGGKTIGQSQLFVDDLAGARHEAGDFIQAGVDWDEVRPLVAALPSWPRTDRPILLKTVGCAAWDLAACRTARRMMAG